MSPTQALKTVENRAPNLTGDRNPHLSVTILNRVVGSVDRFELPIGSTRGLRIINGAEILVEVHTTGATPTTIDTGTEIIPLRRAGPAVWLAGFGYWNYLNDPGATPTLDIIGVSKGGLFRDSIPVSVVHDPLVAP